MRDAIQTGSRLSQNLLVLGAFAALQDDY